jgi:hypothetical protein
MATALGHVVDKLQVVADAADEQRLLDTLSAPQAPTVLGFVNAHAMNLMAGNGEFYKALVAADVLLRDGSGMGLLYRRLGLAPGLNMNGTDFIPVCWRPAKAGASPCGAPGSLPWPRRRSTAKPASGCGRCRCTMASPTWRPICSWPASCNPS